MDESKSDIVSPPVEPTVVVKPIKRIIITSINGKTWDAEFEGTITSRDIGKIYRKLRVDYAKTQRRRSIEKKMKDYQTSKTTLVVTQKERSNG